MKVLILFDFQFCFSVLLLAVTAGSWTPRTVDGARILAVQTVAARSHWNFMSAVLRALTDAGHHVTAFTSLSDGSRENYTEVNTSDTVLRLQENDVLPMLHAAGSAFAFVRVVTGLNRLFCDMVYRNPRLGDVMHGVNHTRTASQFDVILVEPFGLDCMSYLADVLDAPIIYVVPSPMITFAERSFTGHTSNPACVSHLLARHAVPVTFTQRLANVVLSAFSALAVSCHIAAARVTDPRPYDFSPPVSPSVIFQNSHYATEASRPVPTNVIDVGGIHLRPAKSLPKVRAITAKSVQNS